MENKKKFCARPFEAIHLDPNGNVRVCSWTDATIGNLLENTADEIWHSEKAEMVRELIKNQSFEFCRSVSCPCIENSELEWLDDAEFAKRCTVSEMPKHVNAAYDFMCNHSCPSCRSEVFKPDKEYLEKTEEVSKKAVVLLNNADSFSTDGNGDLFASTSVIRMLQETNPKNPECRVTLETNGVLFTPENWEKIKHLAKHHLTVVVTPNSYEKDTYKYLSGGHDNVKKLKENLLFMKYLREKGDLNHLSISIVVQDRNFRELPSFIEKSIDEYGADDVIVKPLYKWFCLSEEDYWFKDVLNPLHPYHADYLEMMKNPIISHPKVYLWGGRNLHEAKKHPAYKYEKQMEIIGKYCDVDKAKGKINSYLKDIIKTQESDEKVYFYGDNYLSKFFLSQIDNESKKSVQIMARDLSGVNEDNGVKRFREYVPQSGDLIIVTEEYNLSFVKRDLKLINFKGVVITLAEVLEKL